ncbi:MAG: CpaF/VirB11 family protein [Ethanoligenens sp.]
MTANQGLFFSPEGKTRVFGNVLKDVQGYISTHYAALLSGGAGLDAKAQLKRYIDQYIRENRIAVDGMEQTKLVDALHAEMAEFGFLTKYIFGTGVEEIDVNSWEDVDVHFSDGSIEKLDEHFDSPAHAVSVVRRMLHTSGIVLDNATPTALGHLSKNIRISAFKNPVVDEDAATAASIRIVNPQNLTREDFVHSGTATENMLFFLSECLRYGVSMCVAGPTGSGKTTLLGWLLTAIPDKKRIFTIESGSRELSLVRRDANGKIRNSVIHTLTRDSDDPRQRITQTDLLDMALRFNPDYIAVGEMRSDEANAGQEAARTGIAVLTTIHAISCQAAYSRMVSLSKRAVDTPDAVLYGYVTEAFPLMVYCKQLENRQRRVMEIMECEILPDGTRNFRTLFQYDIMENRIVDDRFIINGSHRAVRGISPGLQRRFVQNGMPRDTLNRIIQMGGEAA